MLRYVLRRLGQLVITFLFAATLSFVMYRLLPGGPVDAYIAQLISQYNQPGSELTPEDIAQVRQGAQYLFNIDPGQPVYLAYYEYIRDIVVYHDFGHSLRYGRPVFDILFSAMPWSMMISIYGLALGWTTNIVIGALMAYREGSRFDYGMTVFTQIMGSIPYYVGALVMLSFLGYQWHVLPTGGRYNTALQPGANLPFMGSAIRHAALPILTGFVFGFGGNLAMRANAVSVIGSNYLRAARIRGISDHRITIRYVMRNAILPLYTQLLIGLSGIFSSSVITEKIFAYRGVGWYTFDALQNRDYPLLMGAFLFFTLITLVGIFVADLTYGMIDPRVETGGERESF